MRTSRAPVSIDTLLTHRAWVQRLARSLVHDQASADDLEQKAWLAALRRPPTHQPTARAWLGRVVRNLARDANRSGARRTRHESLAARATEVRTTPEIVAEAESHRLVVLAVHGLDEPYRTAVLLRWFENLPPREIASRTGVPAETVRTRLRRAHGRLRQRLQSDGPRSRDWVAALAPLMGPGSESAPTWITTVTAKTAASIGGVAMGTKTALGVAAVVIVGAAFVGGRITGDSDTESAPDEAAAEIAALRNRIDQLERDERRRVETHRTRTPRTESAPAADTPGIAPDDPRLVALENALDTMKQQLDDAEAARAAQSGTGAAAASRMTQQEREALRALTDDELLGELRKLVSSGSRGKQLDGGRIVEMSELLLGRPLDSGRHSETLRQKGIGHRVLGEDENELTAFREAARIAGAGTHDARMAETQLAWSAGRHGDLHGAAQAFLLLAEDTDAPPRQRAWNRYYAGSHFERSREADRAIDEYRVVVNEFEDDDDPSVAMAVGRARKSLERLSKSSSSR